MKEPILFKFKYLFIIIAIVFITVIYIISTSARVPEEAIIFLQEYIQVTLNTSKFNFKVNQYFHPDSFFLGGDTFNIVVTPNGSADVWTIESSGIVYGDRSPDKMGIKKLVKVIVKFQALASAQVTDTITFKNNERYFWRTYYLAKFNNQWLVLDISDPYLDIVSLSNAINSTENIAKSSNNQLFYDLAKILKELK